MDAPGVPQPTIGQFCAKVCARVRFWPDHDAITAELTAHLEDHRDVLLERNPALSQAEAEAQAVAAMGDPEALGRELDKSHNPLPGWFHILFRVSVRTALILLLVFCFLPKATDLYDLIADPPLYNDYDTGVIVEHYDQVEVLADYRPEHAVCYLEHYTFSAERVLVTPWEHSVTGEPALRVSVLLKAVHLNPSLRCPGFPAGCGRRTIWATAIPAGTSTTRRSCSTACTRNRPPLPTSIPLWADPLSKRLS